MTLSPVLFLTAADLPVPQDRPFLLSDAQDLGGTRRQIHQWLGAGLLSSPLRGVYHVATLEVTLELRLACLALVIPPDAVVCDRTAGWLHGAPMVLAPGDHLRVPPVAVFCPPGKRLKNSLTASGERTFLDDEIMEVGGMLVTNPLRTACDLGRLLHRDQAFASLDAMLRLERFTLEELVAAAESERFKGYRHIRQLRELAPDADPRSQSQEESVLRRRWVDCRDLPRPDLQVEVEGPHGPYYVDLGLEGLRYGAEYLGVAWHGEDRQEHDADRLDWIARRRHWVIDEFRAANIHGPRQDAELILRSGVRRALEARRAA